MEENKPIAREQARNGTTIHIDFSLAPAGKGVEQVRSIFISAWGGQPKMPEKEVDNDTAA